MSALSPPQAFSRASLRPPSVLHRCTIRPSSAVAVRASASARPEQQLQRPGEVEVRPGVFEGYWTWKPDSQPGEAHRIRYQRAAGGAAAGADGGSGGPPPVVCVHGFGANADQFRKTTGYLPGGIPTFAVDLLGYGLSDKPDPRSGGKEPNALYNFATWGEQLGDFIDQVVFLPAAAGAGSEEEEGAKKGQGAAAAAAAARPNKAFIAANSVGGLAALEAAIRRPDAVAGVQVLNISLRGLHVDRQPAWQRPLVAAFQRLLRDTPLGEAFFASVARPQTVRNILRQAYGDPSAVTDELVDYILTPGLQPGAARVFLDFISYSGGPLPESLMAALPPSVPLSVVWGQKDPWENVDLGRELFSRYAEEFVELEGVGHCPMDEAPERVNPLIAAFVARHRDKALFGGGAAAVPAAAAAAAAAAVGAAP